MLARDAMYVPMESPPRGLSLQAVRDRFLAVPGVVGVHDLHAWEITAGPPRGVATSPAVLAGGDVMGRYDATWASAAAPPGWGTSRGRWSSDAHTQTGGQRCELLALSERSQLASPARVVASAVTWASRMCCAQAQSEAFARGHGWVKLFELYRYAKPSPGADVEYIDGIRNLFNATRWPAWPGLKGAGRVQLDHGIDSVSLVRAVDGERRPAIMIVSKPHRAGSDWTPWHDELDPHAGHVRYFGDNKADLGRNPDRTVGNRSIL